MSRESVRPVIPSNRHPFYLPRSACTLIMIRDVMEYYYIPVMLFLCYGEALHQQPRQAGGFEDLKSIRINYKKTTEFATTEGPTTTTTVKINIGSVAPDTKAFPYLVSIQVKAGWKDETWVHSCAGALIEPDKVLTTGDCVEKVRRWGIRVVAGAGRVEQSEPSQQIRSLREYSLHPEFREETRWPDNNFGLIRLDKPFTLNERVATIPLYTKPLKLTTQVTCIASAWARSLEDKTYKLRYARMSLLSREDCYLKHGTYISENEVCGYQPGLFWPVHGGPLVCDGALVGLASWNRWEPKGTPTVFSSVPKAMRWIGNI